MREIKFRAWDSAYNRMILPEESPNYWMNFQGGVKEHDTGAGEVLLMQFTGLLDKSGKEIYESDIVKNSADEVYEVKWGHDDSDGGYIAGFSFGYDYPKERLEVIGNVHEHPELLTVNP